MMLTPKEKAKELIHIYQSILIDEIGGKSAREFIVKQCALIAVDEILLTLNMDIKDLDVRGSILIDLIEYWRKVKKEIEKL